jgi:O-antigen/teichoic acid export membrane protein
MSVRLRVARIAMKLSQFTALQLTLQALTTSTGIFLVWVMPKREYALYAIAGQLTGALAALSDSGVGASVLSLAGGKWPDKQAVSSVIVSGLRLRRVLLVIFGTILVPLLMWILSRQSTPVAVSIAIALIILLNGLMQLSVGLLGVLPRLSGEFALAQRADVIGALVRIGSLAALYVLPFVRLNVITATVAGLIGTSCSVLVLRRIVRARLPMVSAPAPADTREIMRLTKSQIPGTIFYCVQGQIAIWIMAIVGTTSAVADVGALSRLAVIFSFVTATMTLLIVPRISKSREAGELSRNIALALGAQAIFSIPALLLAWRLPGAILIVLGPKYQHLRREVIFIVLLSVAWSIASTLWLVISSRGWVRYSWLNIPIVLATQLVLVPRVALATVKGVLVFNTLSVIPTICLYAALLVIGLRRSITGASTRDPLFQT